MRMSHNVPLANRTNCLKILKTDIDHIVDCTFFTICPHHKRFVWPSYKILFEKIMWVKKKEVEKNKFPIAQYWLRNIIKLSEKTRVKT